MHDVMSVKQKKSRGSYHLEGGATYWMENKYLIEYYAVLLAKNYIHTYNNILLTIYKSTTVT